MRDPTGSWFRTEVDHLFTTVSNCQNWVTKQHSLNQILYDLMPIRERGDDELPVRLWVDPDKVSQPLGSPQSATLCLAGASTKLECGVRCDPNVSRAHLHLSV